MRRRAKMLYEKRGGKFFPVGVDDATLGMYVPGDYLVRVRSNGKSVACIRKRLGLCNARLEVVMAEAADALARAISRVSDAKPNVTMLSKREQKAFEVYKRLAGSNKLTFTRRSACDMARDAVLVLRERIRTVSRPDRYLEVMAERGA